MDGKPRNGRSGHAGGSLRRFGWIASGIAVLGVCILVRANWPADSAEAAGKSRDDAVRRATATQAVKSSTAASTAGPTAPKKLPVVAVVNQEPISREDLARECLLHYGHEVLESLINRTLILTSCQQRNIVITREQIDEEIDRMAGKFSLGRDQWLKMLQKERGISPLRYSQDIIWPTLALRELAKSQLTVTREELDEAFQSEFGPSVKVRLIALDNAQDARRVHAEALARPEEFPALAKRHSKDANSASAYGLIQPIRRHSGDEQLEQVAFALKEGEVSQMVKVGNLYVFLKCEEHIAPRTGVSRQQAEPLLIEALKDRKLREAASGVFKQLQEQANIVVAFGDPEKSKEMPGIAAVINGQTIRLLDLAEECIERHGNDVLEGTIHRLLLDQSLRRRKQTITNADLENEIARAALSMNKVKENGEPDVAGWLEFLTQSQNVTREVYVRDEVWPSVALKKIVGQNVEVSQEDLQKGFEANYGPKVRCRAIVLNNQRRAQEVWEKAREKAPQNPSAEQLADIARNFGDLAEEYSIEIGSRSLRGEVPPIQKHGGQPILEKEAFSLRPGELSGIVQVGDAFIILLCEGYTEPIDASFEEVKELLYRDIHEKKLRVAMATAFEAIKDNARIDNFLVDSAKPPRSEVESMRRDAAQPEPKVIR